MYYGTDMNALNFGVKRSVQGHGGITYKLFHRDLYMLEPSLYRQRHTVLDVSCWIRLSSLLLSNLCICGKLTHWCCYLSKRKGIWSVSNCCSNPKVFFHRWATGLTWRNRGNVDQINESSELNWSDTCWFAEQLLNQLDGAGPPPASKDQIDALPMTTIVQEQVGELTLLLLHFGNSNDEIRLTVQVLPSVLWYCWFVVEVHSVRLVDDLIPWFKNGDLNHFFVIWSDLKSF